MNRDGSPEVLGSLLTLIDKVTALEHRLDATMPANSVVHPGAADVDLLRAAQGIIARRLLRTRHFNGDLFGEPAFDILLDLFVGTILDRDTSVSDACVAGQVPPTTGLRYIAALQQEGLLVRRSDPADGRRVLLFLSPLGETQMTAYLRACATI